MHQNQSQVPLKLGKLVEQSCSTMFAPLAIKTKTSAIGWYTVKRKANFCSKSRLRFGYLIVFSQRKTFEYSTISGLEKSFWDETE